MAFYDPDTAPQRVGGGTITFRVALTAVLGVTLWLLQSFGNHVVGQLDAQNKTLTKMTALLSATVQKDSDTAQLAQRNSDRLDDHEHRITILEVRTKR